MQEQEFRALCGRRGLDPVQTDAAVEIVRGFEMFLAVRDQTLATASVDSLRDYVARLVETGRNSPANLVALARYAHMSGSYELYVYMAGVMGGHGVIPSIAERTAEIAGVTVRDAVFAGLELPPPGSPPSDYPAVTQRVLDRLSAAVPGDTCARILAGNHHRIPSEHFSDYHRIYRERGIDGLLRFRHESLVATLEEHAANGRPWYEQMITPAVVEFVRRNPEIQSGVRDGNSIYVTKIPYAPADYLRETDPKMKRYYQCHCPLARASIIAQPPDVSPLLCHCSGGYEKLPFDTVFGLPTAVTVLSSALAGDLTCRFRIEIPAEIDA